MKTMPSIHRAILLAGVIGALASALPVQDKPAPFILGVFTGDAIMPIGRYTGTRWLNSWPGAEDDEVRVPALKDVPIAWLGQRVPRQWTVWFTTGKTAVVHVTGTQRYGGCVSPPALSLAERLAPPPEVFDQQHPGVALNTAQRIEPLSRLSAGAEWDAITPVAIAAAARIGSRASSLRWLYRAGRVADAPMYFFETGEVKSNEPAGSMMVVRGWVVQGQVGPRASPVSVGASLVVCGNEQGDVLSCLIPVGMLRLGARAVWLLEYPVGETHTFELWDVGTTDARRLLIADGGGC
jgi:hypothetical protein